MPKVDAGAGKVTLRHGSRKLLGIDEPMTMVYPVKDPSLLVGLNAGDKVKFDAKNASTADGPRIEKANDLARRALNRDAQEGPNDHSSFGHRAFVICQSSDPIPATRTSIIPSFPQENPATRRSRRGLLRSRCRKRVRE